MKTIVTVLGHDRPGIIAKVSGVLFEMNANILDITQTVLSGNIFTMVMVVDLSALCVGFAEYKDNLAALSEEMEMEINVQREEIFEAMHRV